VGETNPVVSIRLINMSRFGHLPCGHVLFNYRPMSSNISRVPNKSPVTRGHTRIRYLVFIHRFMTLSAFRGRGSSSFPRTRYWTCGSWLKKKTTSVRFSFGSVRTYRSSDRYRFGLHCRCIYRSASRGSALNFFESCCKIEFVQLWKESERETGVSARRESDRERERERARALARSRERESTIVLLVYVGFFEEGESLFLLPHE
jgi:hypothetical protein